MDIVGIDGNDVVKGSAYLGESSVGSVIVVEGGDECESDIEMVAGVDEAMSLL